MTEVLRLAGIAILGAAMGAVLRAFGRKEAALVCEIACGLALLLRVLHGAGEALSALPDLFGRAGLSGELSGMLLRSAGIAVAAELGAQLCRDAGSGALAQKVELGGKILILCAALPMVLDLCDAVLLLLG